jgi:hypothetical protein
MIERVDNKIEEVLQIKCRNYLWYLLLWPQIKICTHCNFILFVEGYFVEASIFQDYFDEYYLSQLEESHLQYCKC